jgi:NAD(P)-dependent dehydrogenase (short-subunit alcohol dehydrogenase family)
MCLLAGKAAIITGAGSVMGRAMSVRFANEGAKVLALDCAGDTAGETASMVTGSG